MRRIYSYKEFRLNEDFISKLGSLGNFFKGFFKKISNELQKLANDPNKIKEYLAANVIPSLFKTETDNFRKTNESMVFEADDVNTTANQQNANQKIRNKQNNNQQNTNQQNINQQNNNQQNANQQDNNQQNDQKDKVTNTTNSSLDEKSFGLIDAILNKDTGVLGKQGIGMLFNDKALQGEKMKTKRLSIEFIINSTRGQLAKSLKYDQKKNINRNGDKFVDMNYLPTFKEMLLKNESNNVTQKSQNVENIIKWIETNVRDVMITNIKAVKEDDIRAFIQKNGGSTGTGEFNVGDTVRYKMNGFIEGTSPEEQKDKVGQLPILRIEGDNYIFKDKNNKEFTKTKAQIIGKQQGNEQDGKVVDDLKDKLGQIKNDPKKMAAMDKVVNLINQPGGIDKINSIVGK